MSKTCSPVSSVAPAAELENALATVVLRLADDHLILGHRLSEWCGHAPMLEEDLSLPNMALDLLGQSQALYDYVLELNKQQAGANDKPRFRSADDYAFLRTDREYLNCLLVERPNGDFAHTMLRQLYFSAFMLPYWQQQLQLPDQQLAAIAGKAVKEITYHLRHSAEWVIRLGDGTDESAARMQDAVESLHAYTGELFETDEVHLKAQDEQRVPSLEPLRSVWTSTLESVFADAKLVLPQSSPQRLGGRQGRHTEDLGHLLADLQYLQRTYPGAKW